MAMAMADCVRRCGDGGQVLCCVGLATMTTRWIIQVASCPDKVSFAVHVGST